MGKVTFSGIQPSGKLHIGNYIGAIRQWVNGQDEGLNIFCVVDLHAITVEQDPTELKNRTFEVAGLLLASGIDPEKSLLFIQSHNPDHPSLAWILNNFISMGQMQRMTQYKEKSGKKENVSVGLFDYPALMAADILLYNTTHVPVGADQKQHVELTRDTAQRFNSKYGETFVLPEPVIPEKGARVMSLTNPENKMSKSDDDPNGTINLLDDDETIRKKISSAVTDSDDQVIYSNEKPGISNLLQIYSELKSIAIEEAEKEFGGKNYGEFKNAVAQQIIETVAPIRGKYHDLSNSGTVNEVLLDGAQKAFEKSSAKVDEVYTKLGFVSL